MVFGNQYIYSDCMACLSLIIMRFFLCLMIYVINLFH